MKVEFVTKNTACLPYIKFPRFLLECKLSETTKLLYMQLYDRTQLSMKNEGWTDECGYVFCIYTIKELAGKLHKSTGTVKNCLAELERYNLIRRERMGYNRPNRIYIMVPTEAAAEALTDCQGNKSPLTGETEKCPSGQTESYPMDGQNFIPHMDRKLSPNKKKRIITTEL